MCVRLPEEGAAVAAIATIAGSRSQAVASGTASSTRSTIDTRDSTATGLAIDQASTSRATYPTSASPDNERTAGPAAATIPSVTRKAVGPMLAPGTAPGTVAT